jgi:hypothetical protein
MSHGLAGAIGTVLALAVAGTSTAAAGTHPVRRGPWVGEYQVVVQHSQQKGSGSIHQDSSGACTSTVDGSGSESVSLVGGTQPMTVTGAAPPGELNTPGPSLQVQFGGIAALRPSGTITRDGKTTSTPDPALCAAGQAGGGGTSEPEPDCGTKPVTSAFSLLPLEADSLRWDRALIGTPAKDPFEHCPSFTGHPFPGVLPLTIHYNPGHFGPGLPSAKLQGTAVNAFSGYLTGSETADVELQLVPLAVVPAIVLASHSTQEEIDGHGNMTASVACPAAGACSGTLSVAYGSGAEPAVPTKAATAATAAPHVRYPAPLKTGLVSSLKIGSTRISLRRGQHKRVKLRLTKHGAADLAQLKGIPLSLTVTQKRGKARLAYAVGTAVVRPG